MVPTTRLDCLIIGYNDGDFVDHEFRVMAMSPTSAEARMFKRDQIFIGGRRRPYMEALSNLRNRSARGGGDEMYHIGEVPNLAGAYLTSYLRRHGFAAEFVSVFRGERRRLEELLDEGCPRVVAVTTTFYLTPDPVIEIVDFVRSRSPRAFVVVGGPLVNNLASDFDSEPLNYLFEEMGADAYVREAQGEATLASLVAALRSGSSLSDVANTYLKNATGFTFTGARPESNDLDECAIDWRAFDASVVGTVAQTRTARSCAFKCSFCDYPLRAGGLALASVETVERELRGLVQRGVRYLAFIDDTFNVPMGRFKDICRMMIRNQFDLRWFSYFRCSNAPDKETFDLAYESGCTGVFLGIESGDEGLLEKMNKRASREKYERGLEHLNERGITSFASFIVGFPGETERSIQSTVDFINATAPTFYRAEPWWYNHRSPIHQRASEFAITGGRYRWTHATMNVDGACDGVDEIFDGVSASIWMPMYNFDFWALPYLLAKGMTLDEIIEFHRLGQELIAVTDAEGPPPAAAAELENRLFALVDHSDLAPAKYRVELAAA